MNSPFAGIETLAGKNRPFCLPHTLSTPLPLERYLLELPDDNLNSLLQESQLHERNLYFCLAGSANFGVPWLTS